MAPQDAMEDNNAPWAICAQIMARPLLEEIVNLAIDTPSNKPKQNLSADAQEGPPMVAANGNNSRVKPVKKREIGSTVRYPPVLNEALLLSVS